MSIDHNARRQAQAQWNTTACGEVDGEKGNLTYFEEVESARYAIQDWMHGYFDFSGYANRDVLEIGVGQGTDLIQFAKGDARCSGLDITDQHLRLAEQNFAARGLAADLRKSDATDIAWPDASFDCVYSFGVLHHIPEIDRCLAEVHRVLKPGGTFYLSLYHKWSAFHLFRMIGFEGILRAGLLRLGYAGVMAKVEVGADGRDIKPYVTTYSKRQVRTLLQSFEVRDVSVHQLSVTHFCLPRFFAGWLKPLTAVLQPRLGWYLVCTASKRAE